MENNEYWIKFWNNNEIINRKGIHEKVGRTIAGKPISNDEWHIVLKDIEQQLELTSTDELLDIAAGSGAIAIPFSEKIKSVTAIDISKTLLTGMKEIKNIIPIHADARTFEFKKEQFSKIVLYFALQHFYEKETIELFQKIHNWLKPNGICLIGDIPDEERKFNFFNNLERQKTYFNSILNEEPIIGSWYTKDFIQKLGEFTGFKKSEIIKQPASYINAHYRFDIKLTK
jgi:cyclopropane fatty-acyl-phospholipid synthase-like methyltransferase